MEENNSILLNLCRNNNFEEIFGKFAKGAAFFSPFFEIIWAGELFKQLPVYEKIQFPENITDRSKDAFFNMVNTTTVSGAVQFLPINYKGLFLGYAAIFVEGGIENSPQNEINKYKHDLNNLLTVILNLISVTDEAGLVSDSLFLAKELMAELSGKPGENPPSLSHTIKIICTTFAKSYKDKIELSSSIPDNLPAINISNSNLVRIFSNLITNASEAMENKGSISIQAFVNCKEENSFVTFTIKDTGKGIPEKEISNIFTDGFSTKNRGSGEGLSIVKSIVENSGGKISVASNHRDGTTFTLTFPASGRTIHGIAIVEDEEMLNDVLSSQFADDYTVHSYLNGESFLSAVPDINIDLVIIDKKLPGIDGIECITSLRKVNKSVKIILASGSGMDDEQYEKPAMIDKIIKKPYNFDELSSAVEELLS